MSVRVNAILTSIRLNITAKSFFLLFFLIGTFWNDIDISEDKTNINLINIVKAPVEAEVIGANDKTGLEYNKASSNITPSL